jgi:SAM-dependent methyltransferase
MTEGTEVGRSGAAAGDAIGSTHAFYEQHAQEYFERTVSADMTALYARVLPNVRRGGRILDAGCGSGRDLKSFQSLGFKAVGIDASPSLVKMASAFSGAPCRVLRFEDIEFSQEFDAVWAVASLLHLSRQGLLPVLTRLKRALVDGGILFASFQEGVGERIDADGRFFTLYSVDELKTVLGHAGFTVIDVWTTDDTALERADIRWINVLARRGSVGPPAR